MVTYKHIQANIDANAGQARQAAQGQEVEGSKTRSKTTRSRGGSLLSDISIFVKELQRIEKKFKFRFFL